jgi:hypothetical protein
MRRSKLSTFSGIRQMAAALGSRPEAPKVLYIVPPLKIFNKFHAPPSKTSANRFDIKIVPPSGI